MHWPFGRFFPVAASLSSAAIFANFVPGAPSQWIALATPSSHRQTPVTFEFAILALPGFTWLYLALPDTIGAAKTPRFWARFPKKKARRPGDG
jgi:hypothetical protein